MSPRSLYTDGETRSQSRATRTSTFAAAKRRTVSWTGEHMAPPPALTSDQIAGMSIEDAEAAYRTVGRAKANRNLDDPTRQRLNQEFEQLSNRIKELGKGQSPPP